MRVKQLVYIIIVSLFIPWQLFAEEWIRVNHLGYIPNTNKVAVFISDEDIIIEQFYVVSEIDEKIVYKGIPSIESGDKWGMKTAYRLDFSEFNSQGKFIVKAGKTVSPCFRIDCEVYKGTADFLLNYMRQQRCGYNPFLKDSCHMKDGTIVDHPEKTGEYIDVTGGWHDASDYLQYTNTSANAIFQMLFAYYKNPYVFKDLYNERGEKGPNGIPDVLDEAVWGLKWLMKMNPGKNEMYNQIADDRDHAGFRLPNQDSVDYCLNYGRPVYFVTGKRQGLGKYKNRTTGVASIAGKFTSAFALGSYSIADFNKQWSEIMLKKAKEAYDFGEKFPGATQTACMVSPYFYEEQNYVDDMELGAAMLALVDCEKKKKWIDKADYWGEVEPVTPWMKLNGARHYQFYPFVNVGHYCLSKADDIFLKEKYINFLKEGLSAIEREAKNDPFRIGVPFIWCSNNLVAAVLTQARLYNEVSTDKRFLKMEAALRDWLFGCNPWGIAMICGLPMVMDSPQKPHSAYTLLLDENTKGGLVDGPVYKSVYDSLRGVTLLKEDEYADFQNGIAVYHDDIGDYSTNEPTMDGTASLVYYLSALEEWKINYYCKKVEGGIVRFDTEKPNIYFAFSADQHFEGASVILDILKEKNIKASFFLTGNCLRNRKYKKNIKRIIKEGHYLGPHSDKHLLYCSWKNRDSLLVNRKQFRDDMEQNIDELLKYGVNSKEIKWFLPPYEWYNNKIVQWTNSLNMRLVCYTPGVGTNADYTTPNMKNYKSSEKIFQNLLFFEENDFNGLNGTILLIHPGTSELRKDKFYDKLDYLIDLLHERGYQFQKLNR